jgi:hypothetical protein
LIILTAIIVSSKLLKLTFVIHQSQSGIHALNRPMTEGYGDIACQTVLGKLVLACFLSVGLVSSFPPGKTGTKKLGFLATFGLKTSSAPSPHKFIIHTFTTIFC